MKSTNAKLILDYVYEHEQTHPERIYLTQPFGGGQVIDYTWGQVMGEARRMANHLKSLGYEPGARIAILSKNCAHFFMAELAIWMAGYTTVAIFPTEGPQTVGFILEHSEARLLFVGKLDIWDQQSPGVPASLARIAFPLAPATAYATWDAITARSDPMEGRPQRKADEMAMLIYTSGSTGQPKGVMHSFGGISKAVEGMVERLACCPEDRVISYLPLAHVVERAFIECCSLVVGPRVFFAETLESFVSDLRRARPTLFISVPRLWLKFQLGVFAKMPPRKLDFLLKIPVIGRIIARKVLTGLGLSEVRLAGSGSAPIPAELIAWYRRLGLNLMEGYGMSEDFAYSHLSTPELNAIGYVGAPYPGVQVRIGENKEVLIKSPGRLMGYFKRPDLDAESFTEDGYFRTGDQGERRPDGLLKITGRLKEVFKTALGKYVAPAPIENMLNENPLIELSIVSGVGQDAAFAMLVLAENIRDKVGDPAVRAQIEQELTAQLKEVNKKVASYEQLKMLVIATEPWTIENGCLTPTMKIKRSQIEAKMESQIAKWYAANRPVVWA